MSGRELHALEAQSQRLREGIDRERLGDAGRPFQQDMPAGAGRDQREVDRLLLPDDDPPHLGAHPLEGLDHRSPLRSLMRARPRAAASAAERVGRAVCDRTGLVLVQPGAERRCEHLVVAGPGRDEQPAARLGHNRRDRLRRRVGSQERAGKPLGVLDASRRELPPGGLRGPESSSARQHEHAAGQRQQDERTAEATGQGSPAARPTVPVHALEERDRPPRAGDSECERRIVARGQAAVQQRGRIGQEHHASRADVRHGRQRRGRVADGRGSGAGGDEAAADSRGDRAHAGGLAQGSEGVSDTERPVGPDGRVGHDRAQPARGLLVRDHEPAAAAYEAGQRRGVGRVDGIGIEHHDSQPRIEVEVARPIAQPRDLMPRALQQRRVGRGPVVAVGVRRARRALCPRRRRASARSRPAGRPGRRAGRRRARPGGVHRSCARALVERRREAAAEVGRIAGRGRPAAVDDAGEAVGRGVEASRAETARNLPERRVRPHA